MEIKTNLAWQNVFPCVFETHGSQQCNFMHYFAFVYRSRFGTIAIIKIGSFLNIFTCCREAVSRLFCHYSPFVWKPSPLSVPLNLATERNTIQRSLLGCLGYSFRFIRLTKTFDRKHLLLIFHDLPLQQI